MTNAKTSSIITFALRKTVFICVKNSEKYSRGRRGAPAKGVGRATGARVQIPLSPLFQRYVILLSKKGSSSGRKTFLKNFEKVVDKWKTLCYYKQAVAESDMQTAKRTLITEQHDQPWTILRISSEEQKPSKMDFLYKPAGFWGSRKKHFNMRVWSWLRMNAGGVLNTCKSNEADWDLRKDIWLSGGRVSNAWVTCLIQGDNS